MRRWVVALLVSAACRPVPVVFDNGWTVVPEPPRTSPFRLLGDAIVSVERWPYDFVSEPSPTTANLHAVTMAGPRVLAFGDHGTILARVGNAPWTIMPSPTQERLRGAVAGEFAVGDHGIWLTAHNDQWIVESTGVETDLYAVGHLERRFFAVGDEGVLIERLGENRFVRLETRVRTRLRSLWGTRDGLSNNHGELMEDLYLVGDGGTIVNCSLRMNPPVCIPRSSPTAEDLAQIAGAAPAFPTFRAAGVDPPPIALVLGREGTTLGVTVGRTPPYDFVAVPFNLPAKMSRILAEGTHSSYGRLKVGDRNTLYPPLVAVGAAGRGVLFDGRTVLPFAVPGVGDLHDLTGSALAVFAVGDRGVIVHGQIRGAVENARIGTNE